MQSDMAVIVKQFQWMKNKIERIGSALHQFSLSFFAINWFTNSPARSSHILINSIWNETSVVVPRYSWLPPGFLHIILFVFGRHHITCFPWAVVLSNWVESYPIKKIDSFYCLQRMSYNFLFGALRLRSNFNSLPEKRDNIK